MITMRTRQHDGRVPAVGFHEPQDPARHRALVDAPSADVTLELQGHPAFGAFARVFVILGADVDFSSLAPVLQLLCRLVERVRPGVGIGQDLHVDPVHQRLHEAPADGLAGPHLGEMVLLDGLADRAFLPVVGQGSGEHPVGVGHQVHRLVGTRKVEVGLCGEPEAGGIHPFSAKAFQEVRG